MQIIHRGVLGLGYEVWKEWIGTRPPSLQVMYCVEKTVNSLTRLADVRANKIQIFQVRCLFVDDFRGSYGGWVKLLRTRDRFHSDGLIFLGGTELLKTTNNMADNCIARNTRPKQDEDMIKDRHTAINYWDKRFCSFHGYRKKSASCWKVDLHGTMFPLRH